MKIFITGGTGFIGAHLIKALTELGHIITILTRNVKRDRLSSSVSYIEGNPMMPGHWQEHIKNHDVVINLAGKSIFCRWTEANKTEILQSRIQTTKNIVDAIKHDGTKTTTLINASAVGYYGFHGNESIDESFPAGDDFLAHIAEQWEDAAKTAEKYHIRVVLCRIGVVLGENGGALKKMLSGFKYGLGTPLGSGKQWFPWISIDDLTRIIVFAIDNDKLSGPINCTAPKPVTNREFSKTLGKVLRRPVIFPSPPKWIIRLILGEFAFVLLEGQRALPKKLLDHGFRFKHNKLFLALSDLI